MSDLRVVVLATLVVSAWHLAHPLGHAVGLAIAEWLTR